VKIATLLFLSIYSLRLRTPRFLGLHDTLPCVLIYVMVVSTSRQKLSALAEHCNAGESLKAMVSKDIPTIM